tara:strand:+ start:5880 stop:6206 length:327 start_codon:yes stop_codon:yes gene_type:complete
MNTLTSMLKLVEKNKEMLMTVVAAVVVMYLFQEELMSLLVKGEDVVEDAVGLVGSAVNGVGGVVKNVLPKVPSCSGKKMSEKKTEVPSKAKVAGVSGFDGSWGSASAL